MQRNVMALLALSIVILGNRCEDNGDMSTARLVALAEASTDVEDLLQRLPSHMRMNYTLMEQSGGLQPASLEHPRLVHFGSDARFFLAASTDPRDPEREVLEFAELDSESGGWRFQTLDLRTSPATLEEPQVCLGCHGSEVPRPIWGSYPGWPGAFGPDEDPMPAYQGERFLRIREEPQDRFGHLVHTRRVQRPGREIFSLPGRAYPYTNIVLNAELAASAAEGFFTAIQRHRAYRQLREGFFLLRRNCDLRSSAAHERVLRAIAREGVRGGNVAALYEAFGLPARTRALGLNMNGPSLGRLGRTWNSAESWVESFIEFLVLDDLIRDHPELGRRLAQLPQRTFRIRGLGNLEEARQFRLHRLFRLTGEERQRDRAASPIELGRVEEGVLEPAASTLCDFLIDR